MAAELLPDMAKFRDEDGRSFLTLDVHTATNNLLAAEVIMIRPWRPWSACTHVVCQVHCLHMDTVAKVDELGLADLQARTLLAALQAEAHDVLDDSASR